MLARHPIHDELDKIKKLANKLQAATNMVEMDRIVESLMKSLKILMTVSEQELQIFSAESSDFANTLWQTILKEKDSETKVTDKLRADSKDPSITPSQEDVARKLQKMKGWRLEEIIKAACPLFEVRIDDDTGLLGTSRDRVATKLDNIIMNEHFFINHKAVIGVNHAHFEKLRSLLKQRSPLQSLFVCLSQYQKDRADNKATNETTMERTKLKAQGFFSSLQSVYSPLMLYVQNKKVTLDMPHNPFKNILAAPSPDPKESRIFLSKPATASPNDVYNAIYEGLLEIGGKRYKGKNDQDAIRAFIKQNLPQDSIDFEKVMNNLEAVYRKEIVEFPTLALDSFDSKTRYTAKKKRANLYIEDGELYIKATHSSFSATSFESRTPPAIASVEATFKLHTSKNNAKGEVIREAACELVNLQHTYPAPPLFVRIRQFYNDLTFTQKMALCFTISAIFVALTVLTAGAALAGALGVAGGTVGGVIIHTIASSVGTAAVTAGVGTATVAAGSGATHMLLAAQPKASSTALIAKKAGYEVALSPPTEKPAPPKDKRPDPIPEDKSTSLPQEQQSEEEKSTPRSSNLAF